MQEKVVSSDWKYQKPKVTVLGNVTLDDGYSILNAFSADDLSNPLS